MSKADNLKGFYRIPADNRDLNYGKYFEKGDLLPELEDYNSHNTKQLNIKEIQEKLLSLEYLQNILKNKN